MDNKKLLNDDDTIGVTGGAWEGISSSLFVKNDDDKYICPTCHVGTLEMGGMLGSLRAFFCNNDDCHKRYQKNTNTGRWQIYN